MDLHEWRYSSGVFVDEILLNLAIITCLGLMPLADVRSLGHL